MISPEELYEFFNLKGVNFFTGVPDSLMENFLHFLQVNCPKESHIVTANEGLAIALASGYYFQTGGIPLVYLQNSGLGNIINPITSLADKEIFGVPMILFIGWRGRPEIKDEPQHRKMGRITASMLEILELPVFKLSGSKTDVFTTIDAAICTAIEKKNPVAILVSENFFDSYRYIKKESVLKLSREYSIQKIINQLSGDELVVCSTGKIGREFYENNVAMDNKIKKYLLCAGAMGHANHIALGLKLSSNKRVVMLDGDGALLMHLGSLTSIAHYAGEKFIHIIFNNGCHESVGGQPTEGFRVNLSALAIACGYRKVYSIDNENDLNEWLHKGLPDNAVQFVEIKINSNSRLNLGRPAGEPGEWKKKFMAG